jgi:methionyl-tRNA formyltransferase
MRLVMMGTGTFAAPTFAELLASPHEVVGLVTQPDKPIGAARGSSRLTKSVMKELAAKHGIDVFQPDSINTAEGVARLKAWRADLLVVAAYGQILKADVLAATRLGGINVHASLLPKYRGAAPIAWAIWNGETTTGVTIIRMTTGLDAGECLAQTEVLIEPTETAGELEARLAPVGAKLAVEMVNKLTAGPIIGTPQDKAMVTKAPKLTKELGLIDWTQPATRVVNQIRAMQPWPTAYTWLHRVTGEPVRLQIQRAEVANAERRAPGTAWWDGVAMLTSAGEKAVRILELQPAGKRRMLAADFVRGMQLGPAARLGGEAR